jgi:uncharacterized protein (DUF58 family)
MFLSKPTRPALAGSFLVALLLALATTLAGNHAAAAANQGAMLKFKPDKHDFGKVAATNNSAPLTVTVTNKSSAPVTFMSIVAAETFSIQSDKCSGAPLAPGRSCKVEVVFHPLVTGIVNDQKALTFTDSAADSPQQVELDGQGIVGGFI